MANFENRNRDSAKNEPSRGQDKEKFAPGQQGQGQQEGEGSEPRQGQGQGGAQEYPGEGVGQHYPSSGQQTGGSQDDNKPSGEEAGSDNDGAE